jgi:hypothetical protein
MHAREPAARSAAVPGARTGRTDRARLPPEINVQSRSQGADLIHI